MQYPQTASKSLASRLHHRVSTGGGFGGFLLSMTTKRCTMCKETKCLDLFGPQKLGKFGVTSRCRPCAKKVSAQWSKLNREKKNAQLKRWRDANREKVKTDERSYYAANREKRIQSTIDWQKRNPESKLMCGSTYRANHKDALKDWRHRNKTGINATNRGRAESLRKATPAWLSKSHKSCMKTIYRMSIRISECTGIKHHVDHVHPLNAENSCGLHVPWNIQAIPARLNLKKKNKLERGCY